MPCQPGRVDEEVYDDDRQDVLPGSPVLDQTTEGVADAHVPLYGDGDDHVDRAVVGNVAQMVQAGHKVCRMIYYQSGKTNFSLEFKIYWSIG